MNKTEHHYNKNTIIKVSIHLTVVSDDYHYFPGLKFLGITLKKPGVYDSYFHKFQDMLDLPRHTLIGQTVYLLPHVTAHFQDEHRLTIFFNNDSDAREYAHRTWLKGGPFITEYI